MADQPDGDLAGLIGRTDSAQLLPAHYAGAPTPRRFALVSAIALGIGADASERWLAVLRADSGELFASPLVVSGGQARSVRRAIPGDGAADDLLRLLSVAAAAHGRSREPGFVVSRVAAGAGGGIDSSERPMLVDQTHESVVVGEQQVVKWAVRADLTPAPTLVAHLSEAGFTEMARPAGFVTWRDSDLEVLVASAVGFLEGATDGWTWAVADAGGYATGAAELPEAIAAQLAVGVVVADLHVSLATSTSVLPRPLAEADTAHAGRWRDLALELLEQAMDEVDGVEGERLRGFEPQIRRTLAALDQVDSTPTIPVHGDLHVGQILRWNAGYAVADFDGNPVLPPSERMQPQPPARDVAGMLQALDHVGRVVDRRVDGADPTRTEQWIAAAQSGFLGAYLARLEQCGLSRLFDGRLLLPFQVEQECREFLYAVRHLPRWRYVPDQALHALITVD